jgi:hypothetical protein
METQILNLINRLDNLKKKVQSKLEKLEAEENELPSEKYKKMLFEKAGKDKGRLKISFVEKKEYERLKRLEKPKKQVVKNKDEKKIFKVGDMISDSSDLSKIKNIGRITKVNKNDYTVQLMGKREYKEYNELKDYAPPSPHPELASYISTICDSNKPTLVSKKPRSRKTGPKTV